MGLYDMTGGGLVALPVTIFSAQGVFERKHLQAALRDNISMLGGDLLVVAEEFGDFEGVHRRTDLLCVDRGGCLVVVELKRTEDGGHMELQALRYAAMVSAMTMDELTTIYGRHLEAHGEDGEEADSRLAGWLSDVDDVDSVPTREVRIVLVSAGVDREITSTVLWLNEVYGLDIRCVRLTPYKVGDRLLLDVQQLIPLPEAADLTVQLRRRQQAARVQAASGRDFTRYIITTPDGGTPPLAKRQAVRKMVVELATRGIGADALKSALPSGKFLVVDGDLEGEELTAAFVAKYPSAELNLGRWFLDTPIRDGGKAWLLSMMWGLQTEQVLADLAALDPSIGVTYESA